MIVVLGRDDVSQGSMSKTENVEHKQVIDLRDLWNEALFMIW